MKKLIWIVLAAFIIFLFTPMAVSMFQGQITQHAKAKWAPMAQYQLGNLCFWTIRYGPALQCYNLLLDRYPGHPRKRATSMFRVAICHERLRQYEAAIRAYERLVAAYPNNKNAGHAEGQLKKLREVHGIE